VTIAFTRDGSFLAQMASSALTFTTILFKIGNVDSTGADAFGSAAEAT